MSRARSTRPANCPYVGKGGLKLQFALEHFGIDPRGRACADLGCNVGGFTDCLLQKGAARVHAVDTGYGIFEWKLRRDPRVVTVERTNVLRWETAERFELVVADMGWTRQALLLPAAAGLLAPGGTILSLVKPSYEAPRALLAGGLLDERHHEGILDEVRRTVPGSLKVEGMVRSPVEGSGGNVEHWMRLSGG